MAWVSPRYCAPLLMPLDAAVRLPEQSCGVEVLIEGAVLAADDPATMFVMHILPDPLKLRGVADDWSMVIRSFSVVVVVSNREANLRPPGRRW